MRLLDHEFALIKIKGGVRARDVDDWMPFSTVEDAVDYLRDLTGRDYGHDSAAWEVAIDCIGRDQLYELLNRKHERDRRHPK